MKKRYLIVILLAAVIGILLIGKNIIVKIAVERGVRAATGLSLKIKKLDLGIIATRVGIKEMKIFNPKGFDDEIMCYVPEIFVDYNLGAMIKGKVLLEDVRLNLDRLTIVKNKQGQTNLDALKAKKARANPPQQRENDGKKAREKKVPKIQINHLVLKIGTVIYKDYSKGEKPVVKEYHINISEEINDIMDVKALLGIIVARTLAKTALTSLADFNKDVVKDAVGASKQVVDILKSTAETFREQIKLPFDGSGLTP